VYAAVLSQISVRYSAGSPLIGSPCTLARPDAAWITLSYTRRVLYGPSWPYPEIEV